MVLIVGKFGFFENPHCISTCTKEVVLPAVLTMTVAFAVTMATMSAAVVMVLHIKENYIYCFNELHINRYPATSPYMGRSRTKKRALATKLTKLRDLQQHWRSGALPGVAKPGLVFKPRAPIQGASCVSWMVCLSGFKPRAGWCTNGFFLPLLLALLERHIAHHQPWE